MRRLLLYSGALGAIALAIAGCGGGDDEDATTAPATAPVEASPALSREELIAQGDGICAEVNAAVGTVATAESGGASQAVQVADLYAGMVDRLKDLGDRAEGAAGYSDVVAAGEALARAQRNVELAAERGEEAALSDAEAEASSALDSFQAAATSYGFEECGEAPSAPTPTGSAGEAPAEEPSESVEAEVAPEAEEEAAPEAGGAGAVEEGGAGGGASAGGGTGGAGETGGGTSGGVGPG